MQTGVTAEEADTALERVSAYYHHFVAKGDPPDKAYWKVVKLFPDAVFSSYSYPKVMQLYRLCNNSATNTK